MPPQTKWRWPWQKPAPQPVRPPKVGGTRAPDAVRSIDFSKPHNFHFRLGFDKGNHVVFESCLLVGFTTPMADDGASNRFDEYAHNRWLVLRHPDGRLVYVPRDGLVYIEEPAASVSTAGDG